MHDDKGDNGHLVVDFAGTGMSMTKMHALGKDLEGRSYQFTEKRSPWLGQITYTGRADGKPTVLLTVPINKDRVAVDVESPETPFSFKK